METILLPTADVLTDIIRNEVEFFAIADNAVVVTGLPGEIISVTTGKTGDSLFETADNHRQSGPFRRQGTIVQIIGMYTNNGMDMIGHHHIIGNVNIRKSLRKMGQHFRCILP